MAKRIRVEVKLEGLEEVRAQLLARGETVASVLVRAAQYGAGVIRAAADADAPSPGSVTTKTVASGKKVRVDIGPDKKHWYHRFFEFGADRHEIKPKRAKRLRFEIGDVFVFARAVQHPGMAAKPFLRPAMDEHQGQAVAAVGDVLRGAVERG